MWVSTKPKTLCFSCPTCCERDTVPPSGYHAVPGQSGGSDRVQGLPPPTWHSRVSRLQPLQKLAKCHAGVWGLGQVGAEGGGRIRVALHTKDRLREGRSHAGGEAQYTVWRKHKEGLVMERLKIGGEGGWEGGGTMLIEGAQKQMAAALCRHAGRPWGCAGPAAACLEASVPCSVADGAQPRKQVHHKEVMLRLLRLLRMLCAWQGCASTSIMTAAAAAAAGLGLAVCGRLRRLSLLAEGSPAAGLPCWGSCATGGQTQYKLHLR